jgi:hypothetical protein
VDRAPDDIVFDGFPFGIETTVSFYKDECTPLDKRGFGSDQNDYRQDVVINFRVLKAFRIGEARTPDISQALKEFADAKLYEFENWDYQSARSEIGTKGNEFKSSNGVSIYYEVEDSQVNLPTNPIKP